MVRELLKWLAGGVGGLLIAILQLFQAGTLPSVKTIVAVIVAAILYRVGSFLVAKFGPQPT